MEQEKLCNQDIERLVLGSAICYKNGRYKVTSELRPEDFSSAQYRRIFEVLTEMLLAGKPIDLPLLGEELNHRNELDRVGGIPVLTALTHEAPTGDSEYLRPYITQLQHYTYRRKTIEMLGILRNKMMNLTTEDKDVEILYQAVSSLMGKSIEFDNGHLKSMKEVILDAFSDMNDQIEHPESSVNGVKTGLKDVDRRIGSMKPKQLVIVAGRPGDGKSALSLTIALNAAKKQNKRVLCFTMEMDDTETGKRALARASAVNGQKIYNPSLLEKNDWDKLIVGGEALEQLPVYFDDSTALTPTIVQNKIREFVRRAGHLPDLVIIDYLQLMESGERKFGGNRTQEISYITRSLKNLAGKIGCPIILLSQLTRDNERQNRKPRLSDLRDSGSIEADANTIILISRDTRLSSDNKRIEKLSTTTLDVAKCRNGNPGESKAIFLPEYFTFQDYTERKE